MPCSKHRLTAAFQGLCPVCLLEEALAPESARAPLRQLTIHVPLGLTAASSVFVVRQEAPSTGLLRLKIWHRPAPADYLQRFQQLQDELGEANEPAIVAPLAASVDRNGSPSVLSEFRRGMPIVDAVSSGALSTQAASSHLDAVADVLRQAHGQELAHGSVVPGNVLVRPDLSAVFVVDFGLSALLEPRRPHAAMAVRDLEALAALRAAVTRL